MATIGLDIGNCFGYMEIVSHKGNAEALIALMPEKMAKNGLPTDVYVKPGSTPKVSQAVSSGGRKFKASECCRVRMVKNKLLPQEYGQISETFRCELPNGTVFTPRLKDLFGAIVKEMVTVANQSDELQEPVYRVVAAVPSIFAEHETHKGLQIIREAISAVTVKDPTGNSHKLELVDVIPEPVAASIAFLHARANGSFGGELLQKDHCAAVYDYGHGTFDTALTSVNIKDLTYHVWHRDGIKVGGSDMDVAIYEYFSTQLEENGIDTDRLSQLDRDRLLDMAREAKEALTDDLEYENIIIINARSATLTLTRKYLNEIIAEDVKQTVEKLREILQFGVKNGHPADAIVMTGGCSNIPLVQQQVEALSNEFHIVCSRFRPNHAIAEGAALFASFKEAVTECAGYTYSIRHPQNGELTEIIRPNAPLPASSAEVRLINDSGRYRIVRSLDANELGLAYGREVEHIRFDVPEGTHVLITVTVDKEHHITLTYQGEDGRNIGIIQG